MRIIRKPKPAVTEFSGESKLIKGMFIVDTEYFDWLMQYNWYLGTTGYAVTNISTAKTRTKNLKMHRMIMDAPAGILVDHINRNKLDNRRVNLRFSNKSENMFNSDRNDKAKYYGFDKSRGKWRTQIKREGVRNRQFVTATEAAEYVSEIMPRGDR